MVYFRIFRTILWSVITLSYFLWKHNCLFVLISLCRFSDASLGKQVLDTSINLANYFHPGIQEKVNIKKSKGFIETYRSLDFNKFIEEKTDILSKQINDYFPEFLSSNTYRW